MKEKSLQRKIKICISLTIILTIILGTVFYSLLIYKEKLKNFQKNINKIVNNIYPFYQIYLWEIDIENLKNVSKSLLSTNEILCKIKVYNENNKLVFNGEKKEKFCRDENCNTIEKKVFYKKEYIGKVVFSFTSYKIKEFLIKFMIFNISLGIIISFFVVATLTFIFKKYLSLPLLNVISKLQKIAEGDYSIKFNKSKYFEINAIVNNLNKMVDDIKIREKRNIELTQRLHNVINSMPGGLIITNENGNFKEINDSLCEILKMDKNEILKKNFYSISSNNINKKIFNQKLKNINNNGYEEFEWEFVDGNGNILPVFIKGKKLKEGKDNIIIFNITNISYIKQLEKELIVKEKLESLGILAGGIAHDFNNILTSISGRLELIDILLDKGDCGKAKENIKKIFQPIETAKSLTHQLLTFSKGGAPIKRKFSGLKDLIEDTTMFILSGSSIKVNFEIANDLYPVKIDPEQFSQVIQNIIINSKQALNDKGEIRIKGINDGNYVKIFIRDNGPGIPKKILDKIWQPYFTTKKDGSGLGLSVVYSIIKKHNGEIKIKSEEGRFTEFEITLPALKEKNLVKNQSSFIQINESLFTNIKVLIMDDDDNVRETIKDLLEAIGCKVKVASNGEEVIFIYKKEKFDIIFLDLTVKGGIGGKECIKELLKIDKNVNAIVYSGYPDDSIVNNFKNYGFKAYLKKPFTVDNLKKVILECLNKR